MADIQSIIEAHEHQWMRAWMARDVRTLKALTAGNFRMLVCSRPAVVLDSRSFFEAAAKRFTCASYKFGDTYVRNHGKMVVFATQVDLRSSIDGQDIGDGMWMTDLWRKSPIRGKWRMVDRLLSDTSRTRDIAPAIRSLQLWR